jgi:hypothetical protein
MLEQEKQEFKRRFPSVDLTSMAEDTEVGGVDVRYQFGGKKYSNWFKTEIIWPTLSVIVNNIVNENPRADRKRKK